MSETEGHKGTAIEVAKDLIGFKAKIKHAKNHYDFDSTLGKWGEYDMDDEYINSDSWAFFDGRLFKIKDEAFEYGDCLEGIKHQDGSFSYTAIFYNGGCVFSEAFEDCIKNAENK